MKIHYIPSRPLTPGRPVCILAIVALFLCVLSVASRADFSGSDSFASGSNWTLYSSTGTGIISFSGTVNRADWLVSGSGSLATQQVRKWNVNTGSYSNDWSVEVGVHLNRLALATILDFGSLTLEVVNTSNTNSRFNASIGRYLAGVNSAYNSSISSSLYYASVNKYSGVGVASGLTDATLKISFDSITKTLTSFYRNGAQAGAPWKKILSVLIASDAQTWGMSDSDTFAVMISGAAGPTPIASGSAYFTNFVATSTSVTHVNFSEDFTGVVPIWDISGSTSANLSNGVTLMLDTIERPTGAIQGIATVSSTNANGTVLTGTGGSATGTISNSGGIPRVTMTATSSGTGTTLVSGSSHNVTFSETMKLSGEIEAVSLSGTSFNLVITGGSTIVKQTDLVTGIKTSTSGSLTPGDTIPLPQLIYFYIYSYPNNGWELVLDLTPGGKTYTGTGYIATNAARFSYNNPANFTVTGNTSAQTNVTSLTLKGAGWNLNVGAVISGTSATFQTINGKVYGQTLNYKAP